MKVDSNAAKTAMTRKTPSAPAKWIDAKGLIIGDALDYGCGKGTDADMIGMEKYDPYYAPNMPEGKFDTIMCTYVLNVIEDDRTKLSVLKHIRSLLVHDGIAYITVRRDVHRFGETARGTWQEQVYLKGVESIRKTASYEVYKMFKRDKPELDK